MKWWHWILLGVSALALHNWYRANYVNGKRIQSGRDLGDGKFGTSMVAPTNTVA